MYPSCVKCNSPHKYPPGEIDLDEGEGVQVGLNPLGTHIPRGQGKK